MNWLLDELVATSLFYYYSNGGESSFIEQLDTPLTENDVRHVIYTDGGRIYGHKLNLRADKGVALRTDWPYALRGEDLNSDRKAFEKSRTQAIQEAVNKGHISSTTQQLLRDDVDRLKRSFDKAFPRERRIKEWHTYYAGRNYLRNLAFRVFRAITTNDTSVFDGSYRFTGDSAIQLVQHMSRHGFRFADPEPGDEGTYQKLVMALRAVYLGIHEDDGSLTNRSSGSP